MTQVLTTGCVVQDRDGMWYLAGFQFWGKQKAMLALCHATVEPNLMSNSI